MSRIIFQRLYKVYSVQLHRPARIISTQAMSIPMFTLGRAIHWILDFDGTLTKKDTLNALVNVAVAANPGRPTLAAWQNVTKAYLSDYSTALEQHAPDGNLPTTVIDERKLLWDLEVVEQRSIDRVSAAEIFKDVTGTDLYVGAARAVERRDVQLRSGSSDFLHYLYMRMSRQDVDVDMVNILSVNWSQRFIAGCLQAVRLDPYIQLPQWKDLVQQGDVQYGPTRSRQLLQQLPKNTRGLEQNAPFRMDVYANELEGVEEGSQSTGKVCAKGSHAIMSSRDKMTYLQCLRKTSPYTMRPVPVVYVGDSWTDFECLLAAELGICIRDDPMTSSQRTLADSLKRLDIRCPNILEWENVDEWSIIWARDFIEIREWAEKIESERK